MERSMVAGIEVGGSIPVPNVQQLSSMNLTAIPDRCLRPKLEADDIFPDDESIQIQVFDMCKLEADHDDELAKLDYICKEWRFFQLIGHGASGEVIEKMKSDVMEFFSLPFEEKQAYAQGPKSIQGYGQALVSDEQKLEWSDMPFLHVQTNPVRNMRFWPTCPASFRETLEMYSSELQKVSSGLLRAMAKNTGIDPQKQLSMFEDGRQGIRMNHYPPYAQAEKAMGLIPHPDAVGLTLLLRVNDGEGLQIRRNGKWLTVQTIAGAFIVNIGDIIEENIKL